MTSLFTPTTRIPLPNSTSYLSFPPMPLAYQPPSSTSPPSDSPNPLLSVLPPQFPSRSVLPHQSIRPSYITSFDMDTLVDSFAHIENSSPFALSHRLRQNTATNLSDYVRATPFPNSHSLDSMSALFHQTTARRLLEVELSHSPPHSTTQPRPSHAQPKQSPSLQDIHNPFSNQPIPSNLPSATNHPRLYLGTKSPYPAPDTAPPVPYSFNNPTSPRLIHVSLVARHGTRNPTNSCLQRLSALHQWLTSALSSEPHWLDAWSQILDRYRQDPGSLTLEGEHELQGIGSRFAQLYAPRLQSVGSTVRLRSSYKARAVSSARAFLEGYLDACLKHDLPSPVTVLDNESSSESSDSAPSDADPSDSEPSETGMSDTDPGSSAQSLDSCSMSSTEDDFPVEVLPNGDDAVLRYFERNSEYATFALQHKALTRKDLSTGPLCGHAKEMASRFSKGLGASSSMEVDLVRSVSEACAFDYAHGRATTSMFCRVLTPKDTAVLEVFEKHHRPFFKGHEQFRAVAAPLIADLTHCMRASVNSLNSPSTHAADLRFAHAETLVPLLLLLGIRTNGLDPLNPDFRQGLSAMSPFAANLAVELYEEDIGSNAKRHFVRFRLHERYVESIPALGEHGSTGVVELQHLLKFFDEILEEGMHHYQ